MQSEEAERFAAQLRVLKERAGISFEELARRTGISSSSLHRYCSGAKVPTGYGVAHALAKACGASGEELRDLHRHWALADTARSSTTPGPVPTAAADDDDPVTMPPAAPSGRRGRPREPSRRSHRRRITLATAAGLTATGVVVLVVLRGDRPDASGQAGSPGEGIGPTTPVRVFNIDERCSKRTDRAPGCSIGLAVDPRRNYDARNVVGQRVWHGDVLKADCVLYDGDEVVDEIGAKSTRWYRVRLESAASGRAWLPGIRTRDTPALAVCTP